MRSERRKYIRFIAQECAYAALGTQYNKIGKLQEISMGGLAFEYFDFANDSCSDNSWVAIFLSCNEFHLSKLSCRLICDREIDLISSDLFIKPPYRKSKCALQFTDITENQKERLEYFIKTHTRGTVPPSMGQMHNALS
jgi:hypothetical protein